ncbi:MAG: hypothetical protein E6I87_07855, partial [Chloroflexi bacterium]
MREELATGERLLWDGRPSVARYVFTPATLFLSLFFLLFFTLPFVTFLASPTSSRQDTVFFIFFPLLVLGFFLLPALVPVWLEATRTHYVLTDRRAVIHGWRREAEV